MTDDRVNKLGGPHVIQTFLSDDISEEIQIKGGTARNGGNCSFSMVLNLQKLRQRFAKCESFAYNVLNEERKKLQKQSNDRVSKSVERYKVFHEKTKKLVEYLSTKNKEEVLQILTEFSH